MTAMGALAFADRLLPFGRSWIRKSSSTFDDEIRQTLAACFLDLRKVGVVKLSSEDPLIQQAAKLYLKAHFGYDSESEKWERAYASLRDSLSLSGDYTEGASDG